MCRKEFSQSFGYKHRPHSRTTASVRDGKGLVKIKMTDIGTDMSRTRKSDLGIHVGSVHINKSAVPVDYLHHGINPGFKHSVCRRIGYHETSKVFPVFHGLFLQILNLNITPLITFDNNNLHSCHHGAGRISSMGR